MRIHMCSGVWECVITMDIAHCLSTKIAQLFCGITSCLVNSQNIINMTWCKQGRQYEQNTYINGTSILIERPSWQAQNSPCDFHCVPDPLTTTSMFTLKLCQQLVDFLLISRKLCICFLARGMWFAIESWTMLA